MTIFIINVITINKEVKNIENKKIGRPFTDNPKNILLQIRVNNDVIKKLDYIAKKKNKSRSEIIRDGICKEYDDIKK